MSGTITRSAADLRAPLLVREILIAAISEERIQPELAVNILGLDANTLSSIGGLSTSLLLSLSCYLVRAQAILVKLDSDDLFENPSLDVSHELSQADPFSAILANNYNLLRNLVMYCTDANYESDLEVPNGVLLGISDSARRFFTTSASHEIESVFLAGMQTGRIFLLCDAHRFADRTKAFLRHCQRETVKDVLLLHKATTDMMQYLFPEENEDKIKIRRDRLGLLGPRGRIKSVASENLGRFVALWRSYEKQGLPILDCFLGARLQLNLRYDLLWDMYKRASDRQELINNYDDPRIPKDFKKQVGGGTVLAQEK